HSGSDWSGHAGDPGFDAGECSSGRRQRGARRGRDQSMKMKELKYQVRFLTPAFLGNAEQSGQWRTPPFKALLRQWWRVAYAASGGFNVDVLKMRQEEGLLFGNA